MELQVREIFENQIHLVHNRTVIFVCNSNSLCILFTCTSQTSYCKVFGMNARGRFGNGITKMDKIFRSNAMDLKLCDV